MSAKHSPGPWELGYEFKEGNGTFRNVQQCEQFGDVVGKVCVAHCANHTLNESGKANASLIAAAPDLLEALTRLLAAVDLGTVRMLVDDAPFDAAEAAIAKATT